MKILYNQIGNRTGKDDVAKNSYSRFHLKKITQPSVSKPTGPKSNHIAYLGHSMIMFILSTKSVYAIDGTFARKKYRVTHLTKFGRYLRFLVKYQMKLQIFMINLLTFQNLIDIIINWLYAVFIDVPSIAYEVSNDRQKSVSGLRRI